MKEKMCCSKGMKRLERMKQSQAQHTFRKRKETCANPSLGIVGLGTFHSLPSAGGCVVVSHWRSMKRKPPQPGAPSLGTTTSAEGPLVVTWNDSRFLEVNVPSPWASGPPTSGEFPFVVRQTANDPLPGDCQRSVGRRLVSRLDLMNASLTAWQGKGNSLR